MKCAYCDAEIRYGAAVCDNCGSPAHSEASVVREPQPIKGKRFFNLPGIAPPGQPTPPPYPDSQVSPLPYGTPAGDYRRYPRPIGTISMSPALLSIILGFFSLFSVPFGMVCVIVLIIPGIVLGFKDLNTPRRGLAFAGLALNGLSLLIMIVMAVIFIAVMIMGMSATSPSSPAP